MPVVKVNDINMYYEILGDGAPLVLIEGLGTDLTVYRLIINQLSQKYKVLAFDNRGVGQTDKPDIPYSIERMADDTAELMKSLNIEKAQVLGFSMGGRIAMALALKFPEKVKSLVLCSTFAAGSKKLSPQLLLIKRIRSNIKKSTQPYYAYLRQMEASRGYNCLDRLKEIDLPVLILHGKKDRLYPYELAEDMHTRLKESKLIPFNGGHGFFIWESRPFTDTVSEFLKNET